MAHPKSALKARRVAERRRLRNKPVRTALKTYVRKTRTLIAGSDEAAAQVALARAVSALDRAASKGIIHPNNAARRKSRLMRRLHTAQAAQHA